MAEEYRKTVIVQWNYRQCEQNIATIQYRSIKIVIADLLYK